MHKITTLIPCSDFVLQLQSNSRYETIVNYAKFLKTPLELWMFVPCGEDGKPLTNPWADDNDAGSEKELRQIEYNNAKERCLFKGFEYVLADACYSSVSETHQILFNKYNNAVELFYNPEGTKRIEYEGQRIDIESIVDLKLSLTPTALKKIYGS